MNPLLFPSRRDLEHAPELAVIAVLDVSLQAAVSTLHAMHAPIARWPECSPAALSDSRSIAALLVRLADQLTDAISAYRLVIDRERADMHELDELPF